VIGWKCSCMHSQRAARSFVRGLEMRNSSRFINSVNDRVFPSYSNFPSSFPVWTTGKLDEFVVLDGNIYIIRRINIYYMRRINQDGFQFATIFWVYLIPDEIRHRSFYLILWIQLFILAVVVALTLHCIDCKVFCHALLRGIFQALD
jgi:hypothetical protein